MKPQQTYVVLTARGSAWEIHGPLAPEYRTLKEAEAAARELSIRYPQRTVGVYELREVLGVQQKVVKQRVETPKDAPAKRRAAEAEPTPVENVIKLHPTS